jgi:hypothetical protein
MQRTQIFAPGKISNMKEISEVFTAVHFQDGGEVKQCISPIIPFPTYSVNSMLRLEAI